MRNERIPLISQHECHFEIFNQAIDSSRKATATSELDALPSDAERFKQDTAFDECSSESKGATVFQTSLNIAKLCMGTGTLALPFAAQKGGLAFNVVGLAAIVVWNYYSADCLLRCLDYLPRQTVDQTNDNHSDIKCLIKQQDEHIALCGATGGFCAIRSPDSSYTLPCLPPKGTTKYGVIAWHAFGIPGLIVLDLLMILLFVGLLTSYEAATMSFIDSINQSTGCPGYYKILPSIVVAVLSWTDDLSFLSNFSLVGLFALGLAFGVISREGFKENGLSGFSHIMELNFWPESLSAASSWFGVVVFGFGVVPVIFNVKDSMAKPHFIGISTKIGLGIAYVSYLFASNGIRTLFAHTHSFDGDVLQALPDSPISLVVRLLMTFVVTVTAPFIVVPCGEMLEGKLPTYNNDTMHKRVLIRSLLCAMCASLAAFVPGFVRIISFVGCFCVSIAGFVLPPLFCLQLTRARHRDFLRDAGLLLLGVIATTVSSAVTFRALLN